MILKIPYLTCLNEVSWLFWKKHESTAQVDHIHAARVLVQLSEMYVQKGNVFQYTHDCSLLLRACLKSGDSGWVGTGFGKLGMNYSLMCLKLPASLMKRRAFKMTRPFDDLVAKSINQTYSACSQYPFGATSEVEDLLKATIPLAEQVGESFCLAMGFHHLRHVYSIQGDAEKALDQALKERQLGQTLSEPITIAWGTYGMADAYARLGRINDAYRHIHRSLEIGREQGSQLTLTIGGNHCGFVHLQASNYQKAADVLEDTKRLQEQHLLFFDYMMPTYPLLIESLVGPNWLVERRDSEIRRARSISRWRGALTNWFPNYSPHMLRVQGRLLCATGKRRKGAKKFEMSIEAARALGSPYYEARAMLDLAAIDEERQQELRSQAVERLRTTKCVIPYAERWLLGDQYDETLIAPPPESLAEEQTPQTDNRAG